MFFLKWYYTEKEYTIETDEETYCMTFAYMARDEEFEERNNYEVSGTIGLNSILIMTQELADEVQYAQWPPSDGIFILYTIEDCITLP